MNTKLENQIHPLITPDHLRRQAVIYCRHRTKSQALQNTGRTGYQRDLAAVARSFGWPESQIQLIDEDIGKSGLSTEQRTGWQRLQTMIDGDQVGAVFVTDISSLSRNVYDFEIFRLRAALHHTLLYSDGRLSDPANLTIVSQVAAMVTSFVAQGQK
jgi:DNA invertase Pin-like site-specific DNA recombinase